MPDELRIAILGTRGIPARYGGFETFAEVIAVRLVEKGMDVAVYCEASGTEQPGSYKGVRVVYVPSPSLGPFTTILFDLRCLWHARKGYDTVYMLGYGASLFCFIPRLWGAKVWMNMDGIEWARAKWGFAAKLYFKIMETMAMWTPDRIIADAEGIKHFLQTRHRRMPPCSVIPYGAEVVENAPDERALAEWDLRPSRYFLVVSRLEPENHVLEIIQGFVSSKSELPLVIVGNHKTGTAYMQRLIAARDSRICFLGAIYEQPKLMALRYHCRAYFHGHSVGGTNPSLLEALGCGNIVVVHDNPFNREVAGDLGLYFKKADDIPALVEAVENMDEKTRMERFTGARKRVEDDYNWEHISDLYQKTIKDDLKL